MTVPWTIHQGDALAVLRTLPEDSAQCCVTSPPYWGLRDYGAEGQIGMESTPEEYVARLVEVFREVRRVLAADGALWLNLGDSYAGAGGGGQGKGGQCADRAASKSGARTRKGERRADGLKPKDLVGIPWRVAFALQADGWWLRSDVIWHKPNPMPESVEDRPTKAHEYLFLMTQAERYYYDATAIAEPATNRAPGNVSRRGADAYAAGDEHHRTKSGLVNVGARETRNRRSVWTVPTQPYDGAHFATMPPRLVEPCILAGSRPGDVVLDPFAGAGTTGLVALRLGRGFVGVEINPGYIEMAHRRIVDDAPLLNGAA